MNKQKSTLLLFAMVMLAFSLNAFAGRDGGGDVGGTEPGSISLDRDNGDIQRPQSNSNEEARKKLGLDQ